MSRTAYFGRRADGALVRTTENDGWTFLRHGNEAQEEVITEAEAQRRYPDQLARLLQHEQE